MSNIPRQLGEEVLKALAIFSEVLANPREVNETLVKAWTLVLHSAGVRPEEVEPTTARLLQTQTFFPTPADFLKLVRPPEDREAGEELAWQRSLQAVRQFGRNASLTAADLGGDAAALWVLSRMGWEALCADLTDDNRAIKRAEFVRTYRLAVKTGAALSYLPGPQERQNDAAGLQLSPILCGRPDWPALPARGSSPPALPEGSRALPAFAAVGREMPPAEPEDDEIPPALRQWAGRSR